MWGGSIEKQRFQSEEGGGLAGHQGGGKGSRVTGADSGKYEPGDTELLPITQECLVFSPSPPSSWSQGWSWACKWAETQLQWPGSPWGVLEQLHEAGAWCLSVVQSTNVLAHAGAPASVTAASGRGHPDDHPSPDLFS